MTHNSATQRPAAPWVAQPHPDTPLDAEVQDGAAPDAGQEHEPAAEHADGQLPHEFAAASRAAQARTATDRTPAGETAPARAGEGARRPLRLAESPARDPRRRHVQLVHLPLRSSYRGPHQPGWPVLAVQPWTPPTSPPDRPRPAGGLPDDRRRSCTAATAVVTESLAVACSNSMQLVLIARTTPPTWSSARRCYLKRVARR